jgi:hypothetical protein
MRHCSSRRRFSAPCGHHTGRYRGCCHPCSTRGHRQGGRGHRGAGRRCASLRPGRLPPRGVQDHHLGADGYNCPSAHAIFASHLVPTASSTYEDTIVAGLRLQATAVLNVRQLVNIVLDSSTNDASRHDLMEQALQQYALIKHVTDDAPSNDPGWIRMDSVVLNWISNSISANLHQVVWKHGCMTCHLWLAIENQFLGNRE